MTESQYNYGNNDIKCAYIGWLSLANGRKITMDSKEVEEKVI